MTIGLPILDRVVSVEKLIKDSDNANKESFTIDLGLQAVKMNIQPASAEDTVLVDGVFAKTSTGFTTHSGISQGDRVTVSGTGTKYVVKGVEDWNFDPIPHFRLLLIQPDNY